MQTLAQLRAKVELYKRNYAVATPNMKPYWGKLLAEAQAKYKKAERIAKSKGTAHKPAPAYKPPQAVHKSLHKEGFIDPRVGRALQRASKVPRYLPAADSSYAPGFDEETPSEFEASETLPVSRSLRKRGPGFEASEPTATPETVVLPEETPLYKNPVVVALAAVLATIGAYKLATVKKSSRAA